MAFIYQVIIQLLVGLIAFLAGFFVQRIRATWAYVSAKRFWRHLLRRDLTLILGDGFSGLRRFEASDVIGRGDLVASYELTTYFSRLGFRRLQPAFADKIAGADLIGRSLQRNLIILGGPDANSIGRKCLDYMQLSYILQWPEGNGAHSNSADEPSLATPRLVSTAQSDPIDAVRAHFFTPSWEANRLTKDYGVIIRARNPFLPRGEVVKPRREKQIVVMYGCYGYGTLAAVLFSQSPEFLEMIKNPKDDIECIVACDVITDTPQALNCVYFEARANGSLLRLPQ